MTISLPSRGLRGYSGGVLAGVVSAGLFSLSLAHQGVIFMMLDILAGTPLFLAGLGAGIPVCALAAATAVIVLTAAKTFALAIYYVTIFGLPASLLTLLALRHKDGTDGRIAWYPEGDLLVALALYPCLALIAAEAGAAHSGHSLLTMTLDQLQIYSEQLKGHATDPQILRQFMDLLNMLAHALPAMIGCGWILIMILSMGVAQTTLTQQKWNLRGDFRIADVVIPKWILPLALVAGLIGRFAPSPFNYDGGNICVMLLVPYFFQGLAVVHARADRSAFRLWILGAFYLVLLFPFQWTMPIAFFFTLLIGIADLGFNFRRRFAARQLKIRGST